MNRLANRQRLTIVILWFILMGCTDAVSNSKTDPVNGSSRVTVLKDVPVATWAAAYDSAHPVVRSHSVLDSQNNIILTVATDGQAGDTETAPVGVNEIAVRKYSSTGELRWSWDGISTQGGYSAPIVDASDNIYLEISFVGTLFFGDQRISSATRNGIFLLKLSPDGELLQFTQAANVENYRSPLTHAIDSQRNNFISFATSSSSVIADTPVIAIDTVSLLIAQYDANLDFRDLWIFRQPQGRIYPRAMAVTSNDHLVIAGTGEGILSLGEKRLKHSGDYVFVAEITSEGTPVWTRRFAAGPLTSLNDLVIDPEGNIYISGRFSRQVNFGGGMLYSTADRDNIFIARLDADGRHIWSRAMGDDGADAGIALTMDTYGNLILGGNYSGEVDFGGFSAISESTEYGDGFLASYTKNGELLWQTGMGLTGESTEVTDVSIGADGILLATGIMPRQLKLGGFSLEATPLNRAVFMAKFELNPPMTPVASDWQPNTGDIAESVLTEWPIASWFDQSLLSQSCAEDPVAVANESVNGCFGFRSENLSVQRSVPDINDDSDICDAATDVVRQHSAMTVLLDGAVTDWQHITVGISFKDGVASHIQEPPQIQINDGSHGLAEVLTTSDGTMVSSGNWTFELTMPNTYPCSPDYQLAITATAVIQCGSQTKQLANTEIFTWCATDNTCKVRRWITDDETCYEVATACGE